MENKYNIFDVANWFLTKENMPHKKLQKMCYYAIAWGFALFGRETFENSEFQAWVHGPVSPELYNKYRGNGWNDLTPDEDILINDEKLVELLESVYLTYGEETGNGLEALSHSEMPWLEARGSCPPNERCQSPIKAEVMKRYYKSIYLGDDA